MKMIWIVFSRNHDRDIVERVYSNEVAAKSYAEELSASPDFYRRLVWIEEHEIKE